MCLLNLKKMGIFHFAAYSLHNFVLELNKLVQASKGQLVFFGWALRRVPSIPQRKCCVNPRFFCCVF